MSKYSTKDYIAFFARLEQMLGVGLTMSEALSMGDEGSHIGRLSTSVAQNVRQGMSFSQAFARTTRISDHVQQLLVVGELHGTLAFVCTTIHRSLRRQNAFRGKLINALVYPMIVLVMCLVVMGIMFAFVIPKMLTVFVGMRVQLPLPTRILIFLYQQVLSWWWLGGIILIFLGIGGVYALRKPVIRIRCERYLLRVPGIRSIVRPIIVSRVFSIVAASLASGISIDEIFSLVGRDHKTLIGYSSRQIASHIKQGKTLSSGLALYPYIYDTTTREMIRTGELSGSLYKMIDHISQTNEEVVSEKLSALSTLIEPALMIGIGVITALLALALMMPLYQLTQSLHH